MAIAMLERQKMAKTEPGRLAIIAISATGARLASELAHQIPASDLFLASKIASRVADAGARTFEGPLAGFLPEVFRQYRGLVLFVPLGAAVRLLAPLRKDKRTDPAVVVVDDAGRFAISTLSGHLGGANELARRVASLLGAEAVVTTGSDVLGTLASDLIGKDLGWTIERKENLTSTASALVNGDEVGIFQDAGETGWWDRPLPINVRCFDSMEALAASSCAAALIISDRVLGAEYEDLLERSLVYRPKSLVVGVGCNRGASASEVEEAVLSRLSEHSLSPASVRNLATIDIKSTEAGILDFARRRELNIAYFNDRELAAVSSPNPSEAIRRIVGTPGVCEPAAMLSAGSNALIVSKAKMGNVTVAVARIESQAARVRTAENGAIFVVGLGPGAAEQMTGRARHAIEASEVVVGYKTYLNLVKRFLPGKEVISSGMMQEVPRAQKAVEMAMAGYTVAVVSSGDAGVYGMAGLIYEVAQAQGWPSFGNIEVVPGVSALNAAAALLGAPLMHDFAVISLSDLLTPWETIARRITAAANGDFVVVLYNPKSGRRSRQIEDAREFLLEHRAPATPVGLVTNAFRAGQETVVTDLGHLLDHDIGMLTTVIVGNSETRAFGGVIVTPRGYGRKYGFGEASPGG